MVPRSCNPLAKLNNWNWRRLLTWWQSLAQRGGLTQISQHWIHLHLLSAVKFLCDTNFCFWPSSAFFGSLLPLLALIYLSWLLRGPLSGLLWTSFGHQLMCSRGPPVQSAYFLQTQDTQDLSIYHIYVQPELVIVQHTRCKGSCTYYVITDRGGGVSPNDYSIT